MNKQVIDLPKDYMGDHISVSRSDFTAGSLWVYVNNSEPAVQGLGAVVHPTALLQALHDLGVDVVGFQPKQSLEDKVRQYLDLVSADDIADEIMSIINEHKEDGK